MKALILGSGIGKRLSPLTANCPKSLIKIGKKAILDYQIESLIDNDIKDIIVTTGPFEGQVKDHLRGHYEDVDFSFIHNPQYAITNYIYTLWLSRELIDQNIILLHGDLVFDNQLLDLLIRNGKESGVLINKHAKAPDKDFKAIIRDNRIVKIGVNLPESKSFFLIPIYILLKDDILRWLNEMGKFIERGNTTVYAEDAFNNISNEVLIRPVYFFSEFCIEIDTLEDLEIAKELIKKHKG